MVDIRTLRPGDESAVVDASHLFDNRAKSDATARFLGEAGHHLLIAYEDEQSIGFITGVEMVHPDKGSEMFIYELGVSERHRGRGIGRELVERLKAIATDQGCYGMWVVTDRENSAALSVYQRSGGAPEGDQVVVAWTF